MTINNLTATQGLLQLRQKKISASEWLDSLLNNIKNNQNLNAFITLNEKNARIQAQNADQAYQKNSPKPPRPLEGLPIAVKDIFCTKNLRTTAASNILRNFIPPYEATVTKRLQDAGAIVIGKTNLDEFAMGSSNENSAFGPAYNPWHANDGKPRVPGGSSGGSAAAVAARLAPVALGTDTGGSVRQPAAFCGIIGFKPTYGRLSRFGVIAFASSLDQPGFLTRSIDDLTPLFATTAGHDPLDSTSATQKVPTQPENIPSLKGLRIAIPEEFQKDNINPQVRDVYKKGADLLSQLGAEIHEVSLPHTDYALAAYYIIAPAEASANLARYDGIRYGLRVNTKNTSLNDLYETTRSQGFGDEVKRRILIGTYVLSAGYYDAYYNHARKVRTLVSRDFQNVFKNADLILAPTTASHAFPANHSHNDPTWMYHQDVFTIPASLAGLPALSMPFSLSNDGLPLGLQLIAPHFAEAKLLAIAKIFENAIQFSATPPPKPPPTP